MFFLRFLILVLVVSYIVWFVNKHIFHNDTALVKIIAYALVGFSVVAGLLWGLSFIIEGQ